MSNARQLIETIRTELDEKIVRPRYLEALQTGSIPRVSLGFFAGQQYHIIASDLRSIAILLSLHGNLPSRPYLPTTVAGVVMAYTEFSGFSGIRPSPDWPV